MDFFWFEHKEDVLLKGNSLFLELYFIFVVFLYCPVFFEPNWDFFATISFRSNYVNLLHVICFGVAMSTFPLI